MNKSLDTLYYVTEYMANSTGNIAEKESGITQSIIFIIGKIFEVLTNAGQDYGFWKFLVVLFALIGFISVCSAILQNISKGVGTILKIVLFIPIIIVIGFLNKKKRKERLKQWKEFTKDLKETNKKVTKKQWALWITLRIILPLIILIGLIYFIL